MHAVDHVLDSPEPSSARARAFLAELRRRRPSLRSLERESGFLVEWWSDGGLLVLRDSLDAELTARVPGGRGSAHPRQARA